MARPPVAERMGEPKRGPWAPEEDIMLVSYIQEHGPRNWRFVPSNSGLQRCGKSCRLRWKNYLRPGIKRGKFTPEEDRVIIRYQALLGNRWAAIAAHLPSRTDNDIKNYWNTHLKMKLGKVNSSGDERAKKHEGSKHNGDAATSGLDQMYKNASAGNLMTTTLQNSEEKKSVYDDNGILPLTSIEKWLLEDPCAPFPQVLSSPAPAPAPTDVPQVLSAPASAAVSEVFPAPAPPVPQFLTAPTPIEKWLFKNPSAPAPQALPAPAPAPAPQAIPSPRALPVPVPKFLLTALVSAPVPHVPAQSPVPFPQVPPAPTDVPQVLSAPASAAVSFPFPQVPPAPAPAPPPSTAHGHEGYDLLLNMFTHSRHGQISFGPFY